MHIQNINTILWYSYSSCVVHPLYSTRSWFGSVLSSLSSYLAMRYTLFHTNFTLIFSVLHSDVHCVDLVHWDSSLYFIDYISVCSSLSSSMCVHLCSSFTVFCIALVQLWYSRFPSMTIKTSLSTEHIHHLWALNTSIFCLIFQ